MSAPKKSKTTVTVTKRVYWEIPNFSKTFFLEHKPGGYVKSKTFAISRGNNLLTKWFLWLCPNGYKEEDRSYVSLFLNGGSAEEGVKYKVRCKFGVAKKDHRKEDIDNREFERSKEEMENGYGYRRFLSHAKLFDEKQGFIVDGKFTVSCDFNIEFEVETIPNVPSSSTMIANYKEMFEDEAFSDIQLKTNDGKVLKTHKLVLAARSPVFHSMLTKHMEDNRKGPVIVSGFDSTIVKEVLRFIYYNEVENLGVIAPKLIYAAEKFQLQELKGMCLQEMLSSLETKNAVNFLKIAHKLSDADELFEKCLEMIVNNYNEVRESPPWKGLSKDHASQIIDRMCEQRDSIHI